MHARLIVGIVAVLSASICGMTTSFTNWEMMDRVNERLPKEEQFGALWWYPSKSLRLRREYKRLYPGGRLLLKVRVLTALMFTCVLISTWCFRFFTK